MNVRFALFTALIPLLLAGCSAALQDFARLGSFGVLTVAKPDISDLTFTVPTNSWSKTESPVLSWSVGAASESAIFSGYQIALGSAPGLTDVQNWKDVGNVTSAILDSLSLKRGTAYFVSLRAVNLTGGVSESKSGSWTVNQQSWTPDSSATTILNYNGKTYLGGSFTGFGPSTGSLFGYDKVADKQIWLDASNRAQISGLIRASVADGAGGLFVGGAITSINGAARPYIAHILADGSHDLNFAPVLNGIVRALALSGSTLYVGGEFTTVNGQSRAYLAALSTTTGQLITSFAPVPDSDVYAMTLSGTTLYVGGAFSQIGGSVNHHYLAALSAVNGTPFDSFAASTDSSVYSLALQGTTLYAGGFFTVANSINRHYGAAFLTSNGSLTAFDPNASDPIYAIAVSPTVIYLGGEFATVGGHSHRNIAAVSPTTGLIDLSFAAECSDNVMSLALSGTTLYAGGRAFEMNLDPSVNYIAALSTIDGSILPQKFAATGITYSLTVDGNRLYVAGDFGNSIISRSSKFGILSDATGETTDAFYDFDDDVNAMAFSPDKSILYIGGNFNTVSVRDIHSGTSLVSATRNYVAAISTATGMLLPFDPDLDGRVFALATYKDQVFIGGIFVNVGGAIQTSVASVSTTGILNPTFISGGADFAVRTFAVSETPTAATLYIGGAFSSIGGQSSSYLAAVSADDGTPVPGFTPNLDGDVEALLVTSNRLYIGGDFSNVDSLPRLGLAALDPLSARLDTTFDSSINGSVYSLAKSGTSLYVGGFFTTNIVSEQNVVQLSTVDGTINTGFLPTAATSSVVLALSIANSALYIVSDISIAVPCAGYAPSNLTTGSWFGAYTP